MFTVLRSIISVLLSVPFELLVLLCLGIFAHYRVIPSAIFELYYALSMCWLARGWLMLAWKTGNPLIVLFLLGTWLPNC